MKPITYIFSLLSFVMMGCVDDFAPNIPKKYEMTTRAGLQEDKVFYYYGIENEKIFLNQVKDKVYVKFTPSATKKQFRDVVAGNSSLRSVKSNTEENFVEGTSLNMAVLEGSKVSFDELKSLKAKGEIASATHLLEINGAQIAYTDEFTAKLKNETSFSQLQTLAEKNNCLIGAENEFAKNQYILYVSKTSELDAIQVANLFYETGLFEFAEPNFIWLNAQLTNDTHWYYQWGLNNTGQNGGTIGADINVESAWAITKGSYSIRVAVIDDGVANSHPDLTDNVLDGYNASGVGGIPGNPHYNKDEHGTLVAGVIAAMQNTIGISGVAPNCKIVPVHVATNTHGYNQNYVANGINWVVSNNKADIINLSFSGSGTASSVVTNAINNALNNGRAGKGCVVVGAAGNDGTSTVHAPANISGVVAVGAINNNGTRWSYSNYGTALDIMAPGVGIYSTYLWTQYATADGTSMAAPHVSGIAALILSVYPDYTRREVEQAIIQSTANYPARSNTVGYGLVDAYKAIVGQMAPTGPRSVAQNSPYSAEYYVPVPPVGATFNGWTISSSGGYLRHIVTSNRNLSTTFTAAGTYSVTAHYTMPNNSPLDLTLRNIAVTSPTAVAPQILTPQGTDWYPWSGDVTFDVFPRLSGGVRYEWDCTELYMLFNPDPTVGAPRIVNPASSSYVDGQQLTARVRVVVGSYPNYTYSPWSNWATITLHD